MAPTVTVSATGTVASLAHPQMLGSVSSLLPPLGSVSPQNVSSAGQQASVGGQLVCGFGGPLFVQSSVGAQQGASFVGQKPGLSDVVSSV